MGKKSTVNEKFCCEIQILLIFFEKGKQTLQKFCETIAVFFKRLLVRSEFQDH